MLNIQTLVSEWCRFVPVDIWKVITFDFEIVNKAQLLRLDRESGENNELCTSNVYLKLGFIL